MNHQLELRQISGVIMALNVCEIKLPADVLRQPTRYFHPSDVLADGMMATGFSDENTVAAAQMINGERPLNLMYQIALETTHENGKTGQGNRFRNISGNFLKCL